MLLPQGGLTSGMPTHVLSNLASPRAGGACSTMVGGTGWDGMGWNGSWDTPDVWLPAESSADRPPWSNRRVKKGGWTADLVPSEREFTRVLERRTKRRASERVRDRQKSLKKDGLVYWVMNGTDLRHFQGV